MSNRDYMAISNLWNTWLFAYIWPGPVGYKPPSAFNSSQETSSSSTALTFLCHSNCSNEMLHGEQPSTDKTAIVPIWMLKLNKKIQKHSLLKVECLSSGYFVFFFLKLFCK